MDGEVTRRLWFNILGPKCYTEPPRAKEGAAHTGRRYSSPIPARCLANVPWPDAPVYTLIGQCPRCHARLRVDSNELWEALGGSCHTPILRDTSSPPDTRGLPTWDGVRMSTRMDDDV